MDERRPWAEKVFAGQTINGILEHLLAEVQELIDNPEDDEEAADCLLLLAGYWDKRGKTADELLDASFDKLAVCQERSWNERNEKGYSQHADPPRK